MDTAWIDAMDVFTTSHRDCNTVNITLLYPKGFQGFQGFQASRAIQGWGLILAFIQWSKSRSFVSPFFRSNDFRSQCYNLYLNNIFVVIIKRSRIIENNNYDIQFHGFEFDVNASWGNV